MNDVEKIKKINEMSQHLKKHGFAENSEEAAVQAKKFYDEKAAENVGIKEDAEEEEESKEVVKPSDGAAPDSERLERNFETFKGSVMDEINTLKADVHNVVEKMNEMVKAINELENLKKSATTFEDNGETQSRLAPKMNDEEKKEEKSGSSEGNHPRSGDLQPGDINLNETFYFGNK